MRLTKPRPRRKRLNVDAWIVAISRGWAYSSRTFGTAAQAKRWADDGGWADVDIVRVRITEIVE